MLYCKRCDIGITFDDSRCLSANTGMSHDIRKCRTKSGHVYCPECRDTFPRTNTCSHYKMYEWKFNQNEDFFLKLIAEKYHAGDWFNRRNSKKTSFDKMKGCQACSRCRLVFAKHIDRVKMNAHEKDCILQTKLI